MIRRTSALLAAALLAGCGQPAPDTPAVKGYRDLLAEANARIETLTAAEAIQLVGSPSVAFVDLREPNELEADGWIPGSVHAPRGMLEFYIDSTSSAHMDVFSSGRRIVFYCAGGARSALAALTAQQMGLTNVTHVGGGLREWIAAGGPVERVRVEP